MNDLVRLLKERGVSLEVIARHREILSEIAKILPDHYRIWNCNKSKVFPVRIELEQGFSFLVYENCVNAERQISDINVEKVRQFFDLGPIDPNQYYPPQPEEDPRDNPYDPEGRY